MKFEGPIDIRPLTVRGTFGIAWRLVKRNFASLFFYALLMQLILMLGIFVVLSPVLGSIVKGNFQRADFVVGIIVSVLLLLVYVLAVILLFNPIFSGTLYGELSARIYANGASTGALFHRTKFSLKRFFTTAMCLIVCGIVIGIAQRIVSGIFGGVFGVAGIVASLPSTIAGSLWNGSWSGSWSGSWGSGLNLFSGLGAGLIAALMLVSLLSWGITLCGKSFICFTYPVAANESVFNFDAVGRSLKLTSKRFGRVFGCELIFNVILIAIEAVLGAFIALVLVLSMASSAANAAWAVPVVAVLSIASIVVNTIAATFSPALDTVLYYDARTRVEGRAWLGMDGHTQTAASYQDDQENYEAPQQPQQSWQPQQTGQSGGAENPCGGRTCGNNGENGENGANNDQQGGGEYGA